MNEKLGGISIMGKCTIDFKQVHELEDLTMKSEQLANMSNALYMAMFCSDNASENYDSAMYFLYTLIRQFYEDLNAFNDTIGIKEEKTA